MQEAKFSSKIKKIFTKEEAFSAVFTLLSMIAMVGIAGLAIDVAKVNYVKKQSEASLDLATTTMASQLVDNPNATSALLDLGINMYRSNTEEVPYLDEFPESGVPEGDRAITTDDGSKLIVHKFYTSTKVSQGSVTINQPSVTMAIYSCSPSIFLQLVGVDEFCFTVESVGRLSQSEH